MLVGKAFMLEGDPTMHFSLTQYSGFSDGAKYTKLLLFCTQILKNYVKNKTKKTYVCKDNDACVWHKYYFYFLYRNANDKRTQAHVIFACYSSSTAQAKCIFLVYLSFVFRSEICM